MIMYFDGHGFYFGEMDKSTAFFGTEKAPSLNDATIPIKDDIKTEEDKKLINNKIDENKERK